MRKVKIITIEGRGEVTIKEVAPLSVYKAWENDDRIKAIEDLADDSISPSIAEIKGWYASEIEEVLRAFMEVNNSFFGVARMLRLDGLLDELIRTVSGTLPSAFADSFKAAMSTPGIMDGLSS